MSHWDQLLDVQAVDSRIQRLDHRGANLAERARLVDLEDQLAGIRARTVEAEAEKHVFVKQQQQIEDEIAGLRERIAHEEAQMYSGGSSDAGLLQTLQDEIASLNRRISRLEDDELELMEQVEPIDARLDALAAEQAQLDAAAIDATTTLAEAEAVIDAERATAEAERSEAARDIPTDELGRYEQIRDRLGGTAVAALESGSCGACHMKLSAVEYDRILHLPADEEVRCEDCDRFLVRR